MSFFYVWRKVIVRGVTNLTEIYVDVIIILCIIKVNLVGFNDMTEVVIGGVYRVTNSREGNLDRLGIREGDICILIEERERRYSRFKGCHRWQGNREWNICHEHVELVGVIV